jgi:hypothetical protein
MASRRDFFDDGRIVADMNQPEASQEGVTFRDD